MPRVYNKRAPNCPPDAVLVDRTTKFGNVFRIGMDPFAAMRLLDRAAQHYGVRLDMTFHGRLDRAKAIECYRAWVLISPERVETARRELRGKDLVCWCAPLPCHADVLLEIANAET